MHKKNRACMILFFFISVNITCSSIIFEKYSFFSPILYGVEFFPYIWKIRVRKENHSHVSAHLLHILPVDKIDDNDDNLFSLVHRASL